MKRPRISKWIGSHIGKYLMCDPFPVVINIKKTYRFLQLRTSHLCHSTSSKGAYQHWYASFFSSIPSKSAVKRKKELKITPHNALLWRYWMKSEQK